MDKLSKSFSYGPRVCNHLFGGLSLISSSHKKKNFYRRCVIIGVISKSIASLTDKENVMQYIGSELSKLGKPIGGLATIKTENLSILPVTSVGLFTVSGLLSLLKRNGFGL